MADDRGRSVPATATICEPCHQAGRTKRNGRFGRFKHVRCFNAWWATIYGDDRGNPYYRWMREGMCER